MAGQQQEPWGGEVQIPRWLRKALKRPEPPTDTPEAVHESRKPKAGPSVLENADKAAVGALSDLYREGRRNRGKR